MKNNKIKIPEKHYVGMMKYKGYTLPYAYITEWGTDISSLRRINTINERTANSPFEKLIIDNTPMTGFKWSNKLSTIQDPRGFEVDISHEGILHIIQNSIIKDGEILEECHWARQNNSNKLLITSSDEYKDAISNTEAFNQTDDWRNVKIGNTVLLKNNIRGVWLGRMYSTVWGYNTERYSVVGDNEIRHVKKLNHIIYVDENPGYGNYTSCLVIMSQPKLSKIIDNNELSMADAESLANSYILDTNCAITRYNFRDILALSFGPLHDVTLTKEKQTIPDKNTFETMIWSNNYSIFTNTGNRFGLTSYHHTFSTDNMKVYDSSYFNSGELRSVLRFDDPNNPNLAREYYVPYNFNSKHKFYRLCFNAKTKQGNIIQKFI